MTEKSATQKPPPRSSTAVSWGIAILSFVGAQFVVLPFLLFLFLAGGNILLEAPGAHVLAALLLAVGVIGLRARRGLFVAQLCLCAILSAMGLLAFVHFSFHVDSIAWILALTALTVALLIDEAWVQRVLGAIAATCFMWMTLAAITPFIDTDFPPETGLMHFQNLYPRAFNAALLALSWSAWQSLRRRTDGHLQASADALFDGIGLAVLLALAYGEGTLFAFVLNWHATVDPMAFGEATAIFPALFRFDPATALQFLLTVAAFVWLVWQNRQDHQNHFLAAADQRRLLFLLGLVFTLLALFTPLTRHGGTLAVIIAGALVARRQWMLALAGLVLLGKLSGFYYALQWPLADKAALLAGVGATLALLLWLARFFAPYSLSLSTHATANPTGKSAPALSLPSLPSSFHLTPMLLLLLAAPALVLSLVHWDVHGKEKVIAEGRKIFIPLAPHDPRSLLQGDYMALNFAFPPEITEALPDKRGSLQVVARLDPRGVASVERLAEVHGMGTKALAANEILLPLKRMNHDWTVVTDAFYFPEGRGRPFIQARFGEFRALPDGRALLVGLADEHLQAIQAAPPSKDTSSGQHAP